jgi:hypothetical protein
MVQKTLALLLVLSWIIFSGVDMLEDLDFESHGTPSASNSPATAKPVKLANDNVELANVTPLSFEMFSRRVDLESTTPTILRCDRPEYRRARMFAGLDAGKE